VKCESVEFNIENSTTFIDNDIKEENLYVGRFLMSKNWSQLLIS